METLPGKARNLTLARHKTDKRDIPFTAAQEALAAESITDEERSAALAKIKEGLLPFNGDWYTHDEIVRLQRRSRRRSVVALVEILALLFVILAADAVMALVLVTLAG